MNSIGIVMKRVRRKGLKVGRERAGRLEQAEVDKKTIEHTSVSLKESRSQKERRTNITNTGMLEDVASAEMTNDPLLKVS